MGVTKSETLWVRQLALGPMKNFVYLVGAPAGRECFVIDPAWDVESILSAAAQEGRALTAAMVTHHHHDHVNGLPDLLAARDLPVFVNSIELEFGHEAFHEVRGALRPVAAGAHVKVAGVDVHCLHTPGHTPGSHCLSCGGSVFTGDTLFVNACGRCDFEGSDVEAMHRSLFDVLGALNSETVVFPGHDYGDVKVSSIGREKERNPYYQLPALADFVAKRLPGRSK
jgi:glyoxylase-like metal-dependent hydrolase (beta-lactamase superfamily II)